MEISGFPSSQDCNKHAWSDYYFTKASASAFQRLYDNYHELRDSFSDYWKTLASRFMTKSNLLGYELLNEVRRNSLNQ